VIETIDPNTIEWEHVRQWDPSFEMDATGRAWLVLLAMDSRTRESGPWYLRKDFAVIRYGEENDYRTIVIKPRGEERWCAGSCVATALGCNWFFSATVWQHHGARLDQRLRRVTIHDDGHIQMHAPPLEPSLPLFPTRQTNDRGAPVFSCRDPYVRQDQRTGLFWMYVCTGGHRWGTWPQVVAAHSESLDGPWTLHTEPVFSLPDEQHWWYEIERVSVIHHESGYWMTFHCWPGNVTRQGATALQNRGVRIGNGTMYLARADAPQGPFRLWRQPWIIDSDKQGKYGTQLREPRAHCSPAFGWCRETWRMGAGFGVDWRRRAAVASRHSEVGRNELV
jgi:hypothetical protein